MNIIPILSIVDCDLNIPTFYFDLDSGLLSFGDYPSSTDGYAITMNDDRIIIPKHDNKNEDFNEHETNASFCVLDFLIEKLGLGNYAVKKVKLRKRYISCLPEIGADDNEIIFNDAADKTTFIFYYNNILYNNSKNYKIID